MSGGVVWWVIWWGSSGPVGSGMFIPFTESKYEVPHPCMHVEYSVPGGVMYVIVWHFSWQNGFQLFVYAKC